VKNITLNCKFTFSVMILNLIILYVKKEENMKRVLKVFLSGVLVSLALPLKLSALVIKGRNSSASKTLP